MEQVASALEIRSAGRAQESVVADLGERTRQDVLQESPDEDIDWQGLTPLLLRVRVREAEGDAVVFEAFE
jgi:hypothetical protein